jgi:hypothetical protein
MNPKSGRFEGDFPVEEGSIVGDAEITPLQGSTHEPSVAVTSVKPFMEEYELVFLNSAQIYMQIPFWLPQRYREEFNQPLDVIHLELPGPILDERLDPPRGLTPPEPGWSRFVQLSPKEQWSPFEDWLLNSTWLWKDAKGRKSQYHLVSEPHSLIDPAKAYQKEVISIEDRVTIHFLLPGSGSGRIYLQDNHGVPLRALYVARVKVKDHEDPFGVNIKSLAKALIEDEQ